MMKRSLSIPTLAACLLLCHAFVSIGQAGPAGKEPSGANAEELARILQKIADGEKLGAGDIALLDNAVIRIDESRPSAGDPEIALTGMERKVYILKIERGDTNLEELAKMHKALLQSQMTVLKVLALIARHQDRLERRVARTENVQRELILGVQDVSRGVDMARLDVASTNADTGDIIETNEEIVEGIDELSKMLEDLCN